MLSCHLTVNKYQKKLEHDSGAPSNTDINNNNNNNKHVDQIVPSMANLFQQRSVDSNSYAARPVVSSPTQQQQQTLVPSTCAAHPIISITEPQQQSQQTLTPNAYSARPVQPVRPVSPFWNAIETSTAPTVSAFIPIQPPQQSQQREQQQQQ